MAIVAKTHKCQDCGRQEAMFPLWIAMYGKTCSDCMDKIDRDSDQSSTNQARFAEMDKAALADAGDL